jgi:transposase
MLSERRVAVNQETVVMNQKERKRMVVLERVKGQEISLRQAARQMDLSRRQAIRLKARYLAGGAAGIVHRGRGRPGNRRADPDQRRRAIEIYEDQYRGFGPTLAAEKMAEREGLVVHPETLRRWLAATGDWGGRSRQRLHRRRRSRRQRFGQMLQIDASEHDWFEGRGPRAALMVLIDDATGRMKLHMAPAETTQAALTVLRKWVLRWAVPESIYADCKSVYWSKTALESPELRGRRQVHSEFGRVCMGLGIELIAAHSPQAKGRVERCNGTLQDRLVKEFRLRGISDIDAANAMLDEFSDGLIARFAIEPADPIDAHRVFADRRGRALEMAFSVDYIRTVARDNTFSLAGRSWQILAQAGAPRPGAKVTIWRGMDEKLRCQWQGRFLKIAPASPKARRLNEKLKSAWPDGDQDQGLERGRPLGDQSPRPPGICRFRAKAQAKKDGTDYRHPACALASGSALGARPRVALPSARSKTIMAKWQAFVKRKSLSMKTALAASVDANSAPKGDISNVD